MNDKDIPACHKSGPLLGLGSSDGLGLCPARLMFADLCALMPEGVNWGDHLTPQVARELVDASVYAERERCLRIVRSVNNSDNPMTANDCADLIANGHSRPTDAELERRTGEPHINGWPLYSGLPPPADPLRVNQIVDAVCAVGNEAARRGEMYPQTYDEQREDRRAVARVIEMLRWYEQHTGCAHLKGWPVGGA